LAQIMHKINSEWQKPTPRVSARRRAAGRANAEKYVLQENYKSEQRRLNP